MPALSPDTSASSATASTMPAQPTRDEWRAQLYAGHSTLPPAGIAPDARVFHDRDEYTAAIRSWADEDPPRLTVSEFIRGTHCAVLKSGRERSAIIGVKSPEYNARFIRFMVRCADGDEELRRQAESEPFRAEHKFERLEPPAECDAARYPVHAVYARCRGCVERGYHLPTTDVSCSAFGVQEPPPRPYRDVARAAKWAAMSEGEKAEHRAQQARLRGVLEDNRRKAALEKEKERLKAADGDRQP